MTTPWSARVSTECFPTGGTQSSRQATAPRRCARSRPRSTTRSLRTSGCPAWTASPLPSRSRSQQPWLPVVIVSGYATTENEARAKAAGVSTVLHKPLSPEMIEDSARDAMLERDAGAVPLATEPAAGGSTGGAGRAVARGGACPRCSEGARTDRRCAAAESRLHSGAAVRRSGRAGRASVLVWRPGAGQAHRRDEDLAQERRRSFSPRRSSGSPM